MKTFAAVFAIAVTLTLVSATRAAVSPAPTPTPVPVKDIKAEAMRLLETYKYDELLALIPANTKDISLIALRAAAQIKGKKGVDVSADIARILIVDPRNYYGLFARGLLKQTQKEHASAIEDFTAAIAVDAAGGYPYRQRGWSAWKLDRPIAGVLDDYDRAIERMPDSSSTMIEAGDACNIDKAPFARCAAYYARVLKLDADDGEANLGWAESYYRGNDPREASDPAFQRQLADAYAKALRSDPKNMRAIKHRGYYLHQLKENDEAISLFTKALDLGDNDAWTWAMRASAKRVNHDYRGAIFDYDKALAIDPKNESALKYRPAAAQRLYEENEAAEGRRTTTTTATKNNSVRTERYLEAQEKYDALVSRLRELDNIYATAKRKIERSREIDRKNKDVANLDSFMGAEFRRAQSALDEAHSLIQKFLKRYGSVIDDATRADVESWDDRLPTSIYGDQ